MQDIISRSVYWIQFPLLAISLVALYGIQHHTLANYWKIPLINSIFLLLQLLFLSAWFSLKEKQWVNITRHLLGLGDILLLACLIFCFSLINFTAFYIISLIIVLIIWLPGKHILFKNNSHIPLAGLQSLILIAVLLFAWLKPGIDITSDTWIINMIY